VTTLPKSPQSWAYTSVTLAENDRSTQVIDVLEDVLVTPENPAAVLEAMADPSIRIVSLTVTEKGYCHNPATAALTVDLLDIAHALQQEMPRSAQGFLLRALARRRAAGVPPFTVLSCDKMPENGALVRKIVLDFAHLIDPSLAQWIGENG
jgi:fructuronate reductase